MSNIISQLSKRQTACTYLDPYNIPVQTGIISPGPPQLEENGKTRFVQCNHSLAASPQFVDHLIPAAAALCQRSPADYLCKHDLEGVIGRAINDVCGALVWHCK